MSDEMLNESAIIQEELNAVISDAEGLAHSNSVPDCAEKGKESIVLDELRAKLETLEEDLRTKLVSVEAKSIDLETKNADLAIRESNVREAERRVQGDFVALRADLEKELREKREAADEELFKSKQMVEKEIADRRSGALSDLEREISDLREKRLSEIDAAGEAERSRIREEIASAQAAWNDEREKQESLLASQRSELEKLRGTLSAQMDEIHRRDSELQDRERDIEAEEGRMRARAQRRRERIDEEARSLAAEYMATADAEKESMAQENDNLRSSLRTQKDLLASYDELKERLGGEHPEAVLREMNSKIEEIRALKEELATRPTVELRERYDAMDREQRAKDARIAELERQVEENKSKAAQTDDLMRQLREANALAASNERLAKGHEMVAKQLEAELEKLRADYDRLYGTPAGEEERREEIEMPYIMRAEVHQPDVQQDINEIEWLDGIYNACEEYGLHFNKRLLTAFHTSLKTAEWAPLTVLAGVSGTGKSELPRLYSHFGGLYFCPVSVQPNWDSQESMLGFFNSIDNRFDAQPVLNFLAQAQKPWEPDEDGYPGLGDAVNLVLLDEMNLAHPELYFAEFLSKLELRRGKGGNEIPTLDVKIGSGMRPYKLPLGRNVLWVGTMNQDETTKSLSDKVLDRSIVMNFPRPIELKRRQKLKPLNEDNRGEILNKRTWSKWCQKQSTFSEEEVRPYKQFIEEMNEALGAAGRAIGHRVWQSVEYYMSNYPEVLAAEDKAQKSEAMHLAFEDQLVQKVMPKLRGIDTRGKSKTECLDKIREQLITGIDGEGFDLTEDFDQSCELGYGQFMWQSANYLKEEAQDTSEE